MYNNTILDDWIDAIDAYIYENIDRDISLRPKINISDKNYFEKLIKDIPEFYNGKLIREKVRCYGEQGLLSAIAYYIVFNMNDNSQKANIYKKFINSFKKDKYLNYDSIIKYFIEHKDVYAGIFNEIVNIERKKILNIMIENDNRIDGYIKLTDSIDVLKFTPQTQHILKWAKIYTIGELISIENLESIKYMQTKNLEEIKNKLFSLNLSQNNINFSKNQVLIEKEQLNIMINELIEKDLILAELFLSSVMAQCKEYIGEKTEKVYKK